MIEEQAVVKVGMADLNVVKESGIIRTTGLGSCVGLTLYDKNIQLVGMAHVMLPSSDIAREGQLNIAKYADLPRKYGAFVACMGWCQISLIRNCTLDSGLTCELRQGCSRL